MNDAPSTTVERDLQDRVGLVTGAGSGIGAAIARHLAARGATVVIADRQPESTQQSVEAIRARGDAASGRVVDLADRTARRDLVPSVLEEFGRIEILVNNAADHGGRLDALSLTEENWDRVQETNLAAPMFLAQAAARDMLPRRAGTIVNIVAIQATLPVPTYVAYGASKGGLVSLTKVLAAELSPHGIRVNAVAPGVIATDSFASSVAADPAPVPALLRRSGRPEEIAEAVGFLAGEKSSFVTGTVLTVDGGRAISRLPDPVDAKFRGYDLPHYRIDGEGAAP